MTANVPTRVAPDHALRVAELAGCVAGVALFARAIDISVRRRVDPTSDVLDCLGAAEAVAAFAEHHGMAEEAGEAYLVEEAATWALDEALS